jgi:hypothetical protein
MKQTFGKCFHRKMNFNLVIYMEIADQIEYN